jgi:hypothetical protein
MCDVTNHEWVHKAEGNLPALAVSLHMKWARTADDAEVVFALWSLRCIEAVNQSACMPQCSVLWDSIGDEPRPRNCKRHGISNVQKGCSAFELLRTASIVTSVHARISNLRFTRMVLAYRVACMS